MDKWDTIQDDVKDQYAYLDEDEVEIDEIDLILQEKYGEDVSN